MKIDEAIRERIIGEATETLHEMVEIIDKVSSGLYNRGHVEMWLESDDEEADKQMANALSIQMGVSIYRAIYKNNYKFDSPAIPFLRVLAMKKITKDFRGAMKGFFNDYTEKVVNEILEEYEKDQ